VRAPRIAIVVVGFDSGRHVPALLESLPAAVTPYRPMLCLIDNGSRDDTAESFARHARAWPYEQLRHRSDVNLGYTGGNNLAFELLSAQGPFDLYVLLNPDTIVAPGWLDGLVRGFTGPDVGIVGSIATRPDGRLDAAGCGLHFLGFGFARGFGAAGDHRPAGRATYACGASLALSRACLEAVQALSGDAALFWSELFLYHDDLELGWRALLAGHRIAITEESRLVHDHDFEGSRDKFFYMERNRFLVLLAYYRWRTLLLLFPFLVLAEAALFATEGRLGPRGRLRAWGAAGRTLGSRRFWTRRRRIQARRRCGDREVLAHLASRIEHAEMNGARRAFNAVSAGVYWLVCALVRW
jgi:GT2 family glycosyltransferase